MMTEREVEILSSDNTSVETLRFLKGVSNRLSGRTDCNGITYTIEIKDNNITMTPIVYVFPNRYRRKESDKIDIVTFVRRFISLDDAQFESGVYQFSNDGSIKRHWRKIE